MNFFQDFNEKSYEEIRSFNKFFTSSSNNKNFIQSKFQNYFRIFDSQDWIRLTAKKQQRNNIFFKREDLEPFNNFLTIFNKAKIKDSLSLNMLNMEDPLKIINLKTILHLIKHNTMGYRTLSTQDFDFPSFWNTLYSNLLKFWTQYFVNKKLYFLDNIKPLDIDKVSPIFRNQISHKNRKKMKKIFISDENRVKSIKLFSQKKNKVIPKLVKPLNSLLKDNNNNHKNYKPVENNNNESPKNNEKEAEEPELDKLPFDIELFTFIKEALEKFIPNVSELWPLKESKPPHVLILKMIKTFFEYGIFGKKHINKIIDIMQDKIANLKNLEFLLNQEETQSKKMSEEQLNLWTKSLVKMRQYFSEIFMMTLVHFIDERVEEVLKENVDIQIKFDESKPDNYKLNDLDLKGIKDIEEKVNFEDLVLFDEEKGRSLMHIFFTYILVQPSSPRFKLNNKIKNMSIIFLNLFSNVDDIYLNSLKLLNTDDKVFINFLKTNEILEKNEASIAIKQFCSHCEIFYLNEKQTLLGEDFNISFLKDFNQELNKIKVYFDFENKSTHLQNALFKYNFLWIILNVILKFSEILHEESVVTKELKEFLIKLFDYCLFQNIFFQSIMMQTKVLKLFELKKERLGDLGFFLIKSAFDQNKTLMVRNQDYLELFLNYNIFNEKARLFFKTEDEYYESRNKFYEILALFLYYEKNFLNLNNTPEYDIICLSRILNENALRDECLDNTLYVLENQRDSSKLNYLKSLFKILAKSSSKRISKIHLKKLRSIFSLKDLKPMLQITAFDFSLKIAIFRIFRNLYIFDKDNVFDDGEKIGDIFKPLMGGGGGKKPAEQQKKPEIPKKGADSDLDKLIDELGKPGEPIKQKIMESAKKVNPEVRKEPPKAEEQIDNDLIYVIVREEFIGFLDLIDHQEKLTEKERGKIASYAVKMLMSTISFIGKQEIQTRLLLTRRAHIINNLTQEAKGENKGQTKVKLESPIWEINDMILLNAMKIRSFLGISMEKNVEEIALFEDFELDILPDTIKKELRILNALVNLSELYSSGTQKNSYKMYNMSFSTELAKRYSNNLEDRQQNIILPYEVLKTMILLQLKEGKKDKDIQLFGLTIGAIYESFKLKKLSTYSAIKKNYLDDKINNIYFEILKVSQEKKDGIAVNLCKFLYSELVGGGDSEQAYEATTTQKSFERNPEKKQENDHDNDCADSFFVNGQRNEKYTILEIFSNILFHATEISQQQILAMIHKGDGFMLESSTDSTFLDMKMFDIIWRELALNFSFVYNRTRQDKLWKEYYIRTIILIKFHQYLCEDNNMNFKKIFSFNKVKIYNNEESTRLNQIDNVFGKFFFRNDWAKKNYILIKRSSLFPIAQAFFEFLTEMMCGPCQENQNKITDKIQFKNLGSFLDTFDPKIEEKIKKSTGLDLLKIKNANKIDQNQMIDLKMSICDFLLTCCEGHDPIILKNQLKKINFNEIMETIIKMFKVLIFKHSKGRKHNLTYNDYLNMKTVYQNSGFNADETMILAMALKLFMYLKILSQESINLRHLLETKEKIAFEHVQKQKLMNKLAQFHLFRKKKPVTAEEIEAQEDEENKGQDFQDGLCMKFLGKFAKKLEIKDKANEDLDRLDYIFFEPNPKFSFLSDERKEDFLENVDRSSHESKIHGLINYCQYFEEEINIRERIKQKYSKLTLYFSSFKGIEICLFMLVIIINLFLVLDYQYDLEYQIFNVLVLIFAFIELGGSSLCLLIWLLLRYKVEKKLNLLDLCEQKGLKLSKITVFEDLKISFQTLLSENLVSIMIMHIGCCILGILSSPGFFAIDIFSIVNLSSTFKYLARSFSKNGQQLIYSFFMAFIIIYVYGIFSTLYFEGNFNGETCGNFIHCYFALLNTAFTNGSGVGGMMNAEILTTPNEPRYFGYVFLSLTFFIFVNCITLNIVFSIIVDSFQDLRTQSERYGFFILGNIEN